MAKQKAGKKAPKTKADRPGAAKPAKVTRKRVSDGKKSDTAAAPSKKKPLAASKQPASVKEAPRKSVAGQKSAKASKAPTSGAAKVQKSAGAKSAAGVAKPAAVSSPAKTDARQKSTKPATGKASAKEKTPAPVAEVASKPVVQAKPAAKVSPSMSDGKPRSADRGTSTADKAKLLSKPAAPRPIIGPVTGVLQAARAAASRTTKVVEVEKERRSHLTPEELAEFRQILLDKRRELVDDMVNLEDEARRSGGDGGSASSSMPIHMADLGTDTWEQEFTLNLIEKGRTMVREIDEALERIENKTYGTCLATGKPISKARLRVKPWAKYCIEYARKREMGLV
ncbi:MAG TPA: TraR/DksA C4-type zinc finger protein [Phycisphaerae bacterium]|nr:TraR/DksA C4-type zinc finger protein [Phycisphaerae bacterium]HPU24738.1 TraR/DksA C4-type zinc finger protein [Phycisphaerae bacterium]HPZ96588.1 TraR/DksA C4-type zinc finger protein [Phycisphaerae bacterium]HQE27933.1 TraR/DksA C4-type zinc finger protein [Phycisphaerae bacterium]